uniref:C3H1-type domain-containing protein n=1 Tax=Rhizophora mucronata TaxID=61149 RepID=A0A2P2NJQ4_RHIMU
MSTQPSAYGNWGDATTSLQSPSAAYGHPAFNNGPGRRDGVSQSVDSIYGGGKSLNIQSSFSQGGKPSRPPFKGLRVCNFHKNGHCKKEASFHYLHA